MLKFSTFPNANPFPKSKEEKIQISRFEVSYPNEAVPVTATNEDSLMEIICSNCWSPFRFEKYRRMADFQSTDIIAFDIDEDMTIDEAEKVVESLGLAALCLPSPSHREDNHRFRLLFPLSRTIYDMQEFYSTYAKLAENFPVDPQCKDSCRFYFGSNMQDGFWVEGKLLDPIAPEKPENDSGLDFEHGDIVEVGEELEELVEALYGEKRDKIPEQVAFFLENAYTGLSGLWHTSFNKFVFTLSLQNVAFDVILAVAEKIAPNPLDKHDNYLIRRAYRDGQMKRDDL